MALGINVGGYEALYEIRKFGEGHQFAALVSQNADALGSRTVGWRGQDVSDNAPEPPQKAAAKPGALLPARSALATCND